MLANPLIKTVQFIWKDNKSWLLFSLFNSVIRGFIPLMTLWVTKELIDSISLSIQNKTGDYSESLWLLFLQLIITAMSSALQNIQEFLNRRAEQKLDYSLQKIV